MKEQRKDHRQTAVQYFDEGFRALFKQYAERRLTPEQFIEQMDDLKQYAETNCRKDIIQAFDMGFKLGVFWHIEITETKASMDRYHGVEYCRNIFPEV
jgi:5'-deoxynucleotidase YfbR-like HD superfamily hydrolase